MSAGGGLVCAVDLDRRVVVWDIENWQPAVFLEIDEQGLRSHSTASRSSRHARLSDHSIRIEIAPCGEWLAVNIRDVIHVIASRTWEHVTTIRFPAVIGLAQQRPTRRGRWPRRLLVHLRIRLIAPATAEGVTRRGKPEYDANPDLMVKSPATHQSRGR
jgi:hypothetical protein